MSRQTTRDSSGQRVSKFHRREQTGWFRRVARTGTTSRSFISAPPMPVADRKQLRKHWTLTADESILVSGGIGDQHCCLGSNYGNRSQRADNDRGNCGPPVDRPACGLRTSGPWRNPSYPTRTPLDRDPPCLRKLGTHLWHQFAHSHACPSCRTILLWRFINPNICHRDPQGITL